MGCEIQFYSVEASTPKEAENEYNKLVEQACYDHGNSGYTGCIAESPGFTIIKGLFTIQEAEGYIEKHAEKWENSLCLKTSDTEYLIGGYYSS